MTTRLAIAAITSLAIAVFAGNASAQCWGAGAKAKAAGGAGRVPTSYGGDSGTKHTPTIANLLDIRWSEAEWPESEVAGYGKQTLATFKALIERANLRAVRPTVIYVAKEMEEKALQKRERDMFGSDDVAIATRFFHTFRMEAKEVPDQELREKYAKTGPTMIFLDHQGNVVSEATGNFDKSAMLKNLDKAYSTVYAGKLGSQIEKFKEFITRYERAEDNVANQSKRTTEVEGRLAKDASDRNQKSYAEEKAKLAELQKEITKLEEERVKLLSPALKDADKAVAQSGN